MVTLLHLSVSPREEASHSRKVGRELVERFGAVESDLRIVVRDLARLPLPHPDRDFVEASLMPEADRNQAQIGALALSDILIGELEAADLVVIDTPMHNFTVPSVLKSWIDHVVRPHRTFRSAPEGKVGLLRNRPVYVVVACGGSFNGGSAVQADFMTPYLKYVFGTMGIFNVEVLLLENLNRGDARIEQAFIAARNWIEKREATH